MTYQITLPNRNNLFERLSDEEIIRRYRANYRLGDDIGMDHVRRHVELEARLTDQLLESSPETRWSIFSDAYSTLYQELPWLAGTGSFSGGEAWLKLMQPNAKIFEVGSGAGALLSFLAAHDFECFATEITKERGEKFVENRAGVTWRLTDGIHLDQFESPESFDYLISDQVTEHFHPQDIKTHFQAARRLLRPGGAYIMRTPHRSSGPHDLSRVFELPDSIFMHLHEFTFQEVELIANECGYTDISAVVVIPWVSRRFNWYFSSRLYQKYMVFLEKVEAALTKTAKGRQRFRRITWWVALAAPSVWVVLRR